LRCGREKQYEYDIRHVTTGKEDLAGLKRSAVFVVLLVVAIAIVGLGIWIFVNLPTGTSFNAGEIREYNGQRLSSVNDFRDEAIIGDQHINGSTYALTVTGLVRNETVLEYDDVVGKHAHYEKVVTLHCVEGWEVTALWEGVRIKDILEEAGYNRSAQVLIFYAQDGYTTSLPLSYILNNNITIAFKVNGLVLPADRGFPFRLVAEGKLGYKWIKWITKIEVSNDVNFRGYWESNGFDNDANWP
jgi:DMSO/TMAO reductase YedYZ molybdopterin-dependent catalytic subunit